MKEVQDAADGDGPPDHVFLTGKVFLDEFFQRLPLDILFNDEVVAVKREVIYQGRQVGVLDRGKDGYLLEELVVSLLGSAPQLLGGPCHFHGPLPGCGDFFHQVYPVHPPFSQEILYPVALFNQEIYAIPD